MLLDWDLIKGCRVTVPQHVVYRRLAEETVLLNIHTGRYYGMSGVGGRFFELLKESRDVESAVDALVDEVDETPERVQHDMVRYCADLKQLGLIELHEPD